MNIVILGSNGQVGKNLCEYLKINNRIYQISRKGIIVPEGEAPGVLGYGDFNYYDYDAVINCVGFGNPTEVESAGVDLFRVTEQYDNMCLDYLQEHPSTKYVFISSGVVHNELNVDSITQKNLYQIAKINAEAKHRALPDLSIVDIRLYAFFSRYANIEDSFFMSQIIKSITQKKDFITNRASMLRDYINPKDLCSLIELCINKKKLNGAYDIYSQKPASKFEILQYFIDNYGLKVVFEEHFASSGATKYSALSFKAAYLGYAPKYSSMKTIKEESKYLL